MTAHVNRDAEQNVLGALLLLGANAIDTAAVKLRLAPEHFDSAAHAAVYKAIVEVHGRGQGVDASTVLYELERQHGQVEGLAAQIDLLAGGVPMISNYPAYIEQVKELAEWRALQANTLERAEAIERHDREAYDAAAARDMLVSAGHDGLLQPDDLASLWVDWYDRKDTDSIPTPWPEINDALNGGLRPGDTSILAGHSGMGKSTSGDQMMEFAKQERGIPCCAYLNEMAEVDRVSRLLAARAGVSFRKIMRKELNPDEARRVLQAAHDLPFAVQPCAGWGVDAIARHMRHHKWGMAFMDLATRIPNGGRTSDWDYVSGVLNDAARQSGTHLLLAVQLNRERSTTPERPVPVLRDLRNTGAWEQDARNVIFVHRREEIDRDTRLPVVHDDGVILLAKASNGRPNTAAKVVLNYRNMRFEPDNTAGEPKEDYFS